MWAATCYPQLVSAVRRPPSASGMRPPADLLRFSSAPVKQRWRGSLSCAAVNISPDALVHPTREANKRKQQPVGEAGDHEAWGMDVVDDGKSVELWFLVAAAGEVDAEVTIPHGDVLVIREKPPPTDQAAAGKLKPGSLDVRLLIPSGYDKPPVCEWRKVDDGGNKRRLHVTIKKKQVPHLGVVEIS